MAIISLRTYFNPRSPRGERPERRLSWERTAHISIHAPLAGSDFTAVQRVEKSPKFQSTLPSRGATTSSESLYSVFSFQSTLPSRGATDLGRCRRTNSKFQSTLPSRGATRLVAHRHVFENNFNPRSPRGERLDVMIEAAVKQIFQSTLPSRGATWSRCKFPRLEVISIHAPLAGSDGIYGAVMAWT